MMSYADFLRVPAKGLHVSSMKGTNTVASMQQMVYDM